MCDLSIGRAASCPGRRRTWPKAVKVGKWELPMASSRSYWDGVCAEIEKKHKRVRDPYPSSLPPSTAPPIQQQQLPDDIKFKISPPSPMRAKPDRYLESERNSISAVAKHRQRLPALTPARRPREAPGLKVFTRESCPRHRSAAPPVKIFDDEISSYLRSSGAKSSVPKLPDVSSECERHRAGSSSSTAAAAAAAAAANLEQQVRKLAKAPKLGTASLLPSFARAVSTDSSAGTPDSGEESPQAQDEEGSAVRGDYLRVPNLSFVSSHPSFRKLSLVDSCDEEEEEVVVVADQVESSLAPEEEAVDEDEAARQVKPPAEASPEDSRERIDKGFADYNREYAYKALNAMTKHRHVGLEAGVPGVPGGQSPSSLSSEESVQALKPRAKRRSKTSREDEPLDFQEIHRRLMNKASKLLSLEPRIRPAADDSARLGSVTMYTSSRSHSGTSLSFEDDAAVVDDSDVLRKIPKSRLFQRPYFDKCHACLYRPFECPPKVKRELPLASLKAMLEEPPDFQVSSSRSSSSGSLTLGMFEARSGSDGIDDDDDLFVIPEFELSAELDPDARTDHQPQRVSFDEQTPSVEPTTNQQSPKEQLQPRNAFASVQSSDRSRTSTMSSRSSDSDESRLQEDDQLPNSKNMAPCHAPVVWRKSFEPLKALKLRKFQTLRGRAAAMTAKSSEASVTESDGDDAKDGAKKAEEEPPAEEDKPEEEKKKKKRSKKKLKKKLLRTKTLSEKMLDQASLAEDKQTKKSLKRAKTTFDLTALSDESKSEGSEDSDEDSDEEEEGDEETMSVDEASAKAPAEPEQLPYADVILKHGAASPPAPIMSDEDVFEVIRAQLKLLGADFTAADLMSALGAEFARRIEERCESLDDEEDKQGLRLSLELFKALGDSRRYLRSSTFDPNLEFSHKQSAHINIRQLRRVLPPESYDLVAPILGMPKYDNSGCGDPIRSKCQPQCADGKSSLITAAEKADSESVLSSDLYVHPATEPVSRQGRNRLVNPYALFLKKPRYKVVVWRPLRAEDVKGYDPEASLEMRAARLLDRICTEFCEWMKKLGSSEKLIDEDTLKDMFEINLTAEACKAMQVILRELPTVPASIVTATGCREAGELNATERQIQADVRMVSQPRRTVGFGTALPKHLRFVPPLKGVNSKWLRSEHVPKDLDTMDVLWEGIIDLDSVQSLLAYLRSSRKISTREILKDLAHRTHLFEEMNKKNNAFQKKQRRIASPKMQLEDLMPSMISDTKSGY